MTGKAFADFNKIAFFSSIRSLIAVILAAAKRFLAKPRFRMQGMRTHSPAFDYKGSARIFHDNSEWPWRRTRN
jgi:hypothetical protein